MESKPKEIPDGNKLLSDNSKVINNRLRRSILAGTIVYAALILYFMFFGFHRLDPYRIRFRTFIPLFILVIAFLEVLQSLTFLGTFDVMDIISNTLGAIIGCVAYKVGFSSEITFKKLVASAISIFILFIGIMTVSETIDYGVHVNERIGPVEAINEISTTAPESEGLSTFTVQVDTDIEDFKIIVTGNAKVWDVGIAEIKHWWE